MSCIKTDDHVSSAPAADHCVIDDRYKVQEIVGEGGMAIVYKVLDLKTRQELALKRLHRKGVGGSLKAISELFENEYYTLTQLAHPGVVTVFNYGQSEGLPYYTMELLDGGELHDRAPIGWKEACSILVSVCSALGLLHSRRQVHRDVTARNIHCTRNGEAKLIDFGAMVPMGRCKRIVGTPAYTPPEVVGLQSLDARADLYSLGATLYYILTGRHAYPAKRFNDLRSLWFGKPPVPSQFVEDIPDELDRLVLSLIELDFMARPASAAEVMEKLGAIAGIDLDEELLVPQAYLSTPTLLGREKPLALVKEKILGALNGRGATVVIQAEAGVGRSRFLDACVLEGEFQGTTIIKADASDAGSGDWAVARSLALQLIGVLPKIALTAAKPYFSLLNHILPELSSRYRMDEMSASEASASLQASDVLEAEGSNLDRLAEIRSIKPLSLPAAAQIETTDRIENLKIAQELRPSIQSALHDWLLAVSRERCLFIAVDDIHRVDEPSAALVAMLSQAISDKHVIVAVTYESGAPATAPLKMLKGGVRVKLDKLDIDDTEKLIGSVFGKTSYVRLLASRIHAIAAGIPRTIMLLAQHLLDKGIVRYQAGGWTLPSSIEAFELPISLGEALKARLQKLSKDALQLAQTMALSPERGFRLEECQVLAPHRDAVRLLQNLNELVTCEILSTNETYYSFSQEGWITVLTEELDAEIERTFHLRLAEMFEKNGNDQFRIGQHLLRAGEQEQAVDVLVTFSEKTKAMTARDPGIYSSLLQSLPADWYDTLDAAIALGEKRGRPIKQINIMQSRVSGIFAVTGSRHTVHTARVLERYYRESGLVFYQQLGDSIPAQERVARALTMAKQQYDASLETERLLPPPDAIRALAATLIEAIGIVYISDSFSFWQTLPSIEAVVPLSPAVGIVEKCREAIGHCVAGRFEKFHNLYIEVLERLEQPDKAQLEGAHYQWLRIAVIHAIAVMEAIMGLESADKRFLEIEKFSLLRINAWKIKKVYHLWHAESEAAEKCQQQVELLQIENSPTHYYQGTKLCSELRAYCCADDLHGIKQIMDDLKKMAVRFPNWMPTVHYARGEYHRIRGDYLGALYEIDKALKQTAPGQNQNWAFIATGYLQTLLALGRDKETEAKGREFLKAAEKENLGYVSAYLRMPLAIAQVKLGDDDNAVESAETAINVFTALGTTGLSLGLAYETRARVAMLMGDSSNYREYANLCVEQYKIDQNPTLNAKYKRLTREARATVVAFDDSGVSITETNEATSVYSQREVESMINTCEGLDARADQALKILVEESHCSGGFLFLIQTNSPVLAARYGRFEYTAQIDALARSSIANEMDETNDRTLTVGAQEASRSDSVCTGSQGERYSSVILGHYTSHGFALTGVAILVSDADKPFSISDNAIFAISSSFAKAGDVSLLYTVR